MSIPTPLPVHYALVGSNAGPVYAVCSMTRVNFHNTATFIYRIDTTFHHQEPTETGSGLGLVEQIPDPAGEVYIRLTMNGRNEHVFAAIERIYANARYDHASVFTLYVKAHALLQKHGGAPMVDLAEDVSL